MPAVSALEKRRPAVPPPAPLRAGGEATAAMPDTCRRCPVRGSALCGAAAPEELMRLNRMRRDRAFRAGQTIMSDGGDVEFHAIILSGCVKLTKTLSDGRQQIVALQFPADFLGSAIGHHHEVFAEAATDVELCCLPANDFRAVARNSGPIEHRLFEQALRDLDSSRDWMLLLGRKTARERVATFFLWLADQFQEPADPQADAPAGEFLLPLTRAEMADLLGLTIETVSRQITHLKRVGAIAIAGTRNVRIVNRSRLVDLAQDDR